MSISRADAETARKSVFLRTMPNDIVEGLLSKSVVETRSSGDVVFRQGEPATAVIVVLSGLLKLSRVNSQGAEAVVNISRPGDAIAAALAFHDAAYPVTCAALERTRYCAIPSRQIRETVMREPDAVASVLRSVYAYLHGLVDQVGMLKSNSTAQRVAQFMINQSEAQNGASEY